LALELKNIWEVCEFEDDIKYGRLEPARFAVKLYDVLDGKTDKIYINLHIFLPHIYLNRAVSYFKIAHTMVGS
jgi:hypothetical protein